MSSEITVATDEQSARSAAILAYALFGAALVTGGFLGLVGVVVAYAKRGKGGPVWDSHFTKLIRLFWLTMLTYAVLIILIFTIVGVVVALPLALIYLAWYVYRVVKGLLRALDGRPYSG